MEGVGRGQVKSGRKMDGINNMPIFCKEPNMNWMVGQRKYKLDFINMSIRVSQAAFMVIVWDATRQGQTSQMSLRCLHRIRGETMQCCGEANDMSSGKGKVDCHGSAKEQLGSACVEGERAWRKNVAERCCCLPNNKSPFIFSRKGFI